MRWSAYPAAVHRSKRWRATINGGERVAAKWGRVGFRKNFPFEDVWKNRYHETKQVIAVVKEESDRMIVVTVFVFYFGGEQ
jgi:hypothetical protein